MIKIGIIGHSPDSFSFKKRARASIDDAITIIQRQHAQEPELMFLVNADPGIGQWACDVLIEKDLPFEVYLTQLPDKAAQDWTDKQQETFFWQLKKARAIHILAEDNSSQSCIIRNKRLVSDCNWLLTFWIGKHQGNTFETMKYALDSNKMVYNGFDQLKLISNDDIKIRTTSESV